MTRAPSHRIISSNRAARHHYEIMSVVEAGIVLSGTEVKSLRSSRVSLVDGYGLVEHGEVWLEGVRIPEYTHGSWTNHNPMRRRKLLLHSREIAKLSQSIREGGMTLIPLSLYFRDGLAKVELAVAKGRKDYDKRNKLREEEARKNTMRDLAVTQRQISQFTPPWRGASD